MAVTAVGKEGWVTRRFIKKGEMSKGRGKKNIERRKLQGWK